MQIISRFLPIINSLSKGILHGPTTVPNWHPLYDKKYYSWGTYSRKLHLYNQRTITVIIHRFYCPETKKTYSLLPFFIEPYQRHINTVIEECILLYILNGKSYESLSRYPYPSQRTIRRWVNKFINTIDDKLVILEKFLSSRMPSYRIADSPLYSIVQKVMYLLDNVKYVIDNLDNYPNTGGYFCMGVVGLSACTFPYLLAGLD